MTLWSLVSAAAAAAMGASFFTWVALSHSHRKLQNASEIFHQRELMLANEQIRDLERSKEGFVSFICHELRNPLHGIIGSTDVITRDMNSGRCIQDESYIEHLDMIESMQASASIMLDVINDVLDLQKFESGRWVLEKVPYDMHALFNTVSTSFRGLAKSKGVAWNVFIDYDHVPRLCVGDPFRIRQCVVNLLSNAFKFTTTGSVELRITALPIEGENAAAVTIAVRDTGIGISREVLPRLGRAFVQADVSVGRRFGGSGLGLSIVKQLMRCLDGSVNIDSPGLGQGSTFMLMFPVQIASDAEAAQLFDAISLSDGFQLTSPPRVHLDKEETPLYVLFADDVPVNQKLVQRFLSSSAAFLGRAVCVDVVENGLLAVEKLLEAARERKGTFEDCPYDIIMLDDTMPVMTGAESASRIRALYPCAKILALTGIVDGEARERLSAVCNHIVTKPFTRSQLLEAMDTLFRSAPGVENTFQSGRDDSIDALATLLRDAPTREFFEDHLHVSGFVDPSVNKTSPPLVHLRPSIQERLRSNWSFCRRTAGIERLRSDLRRRMSEFDILLLVECAEKSLDLIDLIVACGADLKPVIAHLRKLIGQKAKAIKFAIHDSDEFKRVFGSFGLAILQTIRRASGTLWCNRLDSDWRIVIRFLSLSLFTFVSLDILPDLNSIN